MIAADVGFQQRPLGLGSINKYYQRSKGEVL